MSNTYIWGYADDALYEIRTRDIALEELLPEDDAVDKPFVLGLWNSNGDGLALQGTRRELVHYLTLALEHVTRETDPRLELDQALRRLHALREERGKVLDTEGDTGYGLAEIRRLDEEEIAVLDDVAEAAAIVNDEL